MRSPRTLVLVPGYSEDPAHFEAFEFGRGAHPGLRDHGFACVRFPRHTERLRERIDRFAEFMEALRADGMPTPFVLVGYSLGGLVVRGYLRAYPNRTHDVEHAVTIATPHWGIATAPLSILSRLFFIPDRALPDLDFNSDFLRWLNETGGHWETMPDGNTIYTLDHEPYIAPPHVAVHTIVGMIPSRGLASDGLVNADSATLGSRLPAHFIIGPHANHMNLIGYFELHVMLLAGFWVNDDVWPMTVRAIARMTDAQLPQLHRNRR